MGLFNSGKNEKIEKVEKYEQNGDVPPPKARHRSSKHRPNKFGAIVRPLPQTSVLPFNGNYFNGSIGYPQTIFPNLSQNKYGFPTNIQYDLSKYTPSSFPYNPYLAGQTIPMQFPSVWTNGMFQFNDRSPFQQQQQPFNIYQQNGWPYGQPSNYGYMPPMNF